MVALPAWVRERLPAGMSEAELEQLVAKIDFAKEPLMKVVFRLEASVNGWPPYDTEGVWAQPLSFEHFRLDNVPSYARGFAYGDVVAVRPADRDGEEAFFVEAVVERSGHSTYWTWVPPHASKDDRTKAELLFARLVELGCAYEEAGVGYRAWDVPPSVNAELAWGMLASAQEEGALHVAEGYRHGADASRVRPPDADLAAFGTVLDEVLVRREHAHPVALPEDE
jgi:hypothetical protein